MARRFDWFTAEGFPSRYSLVDDGRWLMDVCVAGCSWVCGY